MFWCRQKWSFLEAREERRRADETAGRPWGNSGELIRPDDREVPAHQMLFYKKWNLEEGVMGPARGITPAIWFVLFVQLSFGKVQFKEISKINPKISH